MLSLGQQVRTAPFLALVAVEIDQLTKLAVRESLTTGESIPLVANVHIANVVNPGIVFGVSVPTAVSFLIPVVMMVAYLVVYWRFQRPNGALLNVGIGLYIGGCLGNLMDRIAYGHVTDFIGLTSSAGYAGWVFNVADICAVLGIVMVEIFLITLVLKKGKRGKNGQARQST
jgi:signal peptidase II